MPKMKLDEAAERAIARLKKGQAVKVRGFSGPAKILDIVLEVGYPVAVEFEGPIQGGHSCEKRGKLGHCRWVMPGDVVPS
jgi:hypothetical protein